MEIIVQETFHHSDQIGETGEQSRSLPAHRCVRAFHFMNIQNYGQKKNCGRVLLPKSSRRSF